MPRIATVDLQRVAFSRVLGALRTTVCCVIEMRLSQLFKARVRQEEGLTSALLCASTRSSDASNTFLKRAWSHRLRPALNSRKCIPRCILARSRAKQASGRELVPGPLSRKQGTVQLRHAAYVKRRGELRHNLSAHLNLMPHRGTVTFWNSTQPECSLASQNLIRAPITL